MFAAIVQVKEIKIMVIKKVSSRLRLFQLKGTDMNNICLTMLALMMKHPDHIAIRGNWKKTIEVVMITSQIIYNSTITHILLLILAPIIILSPNYLIVAHSLKMPNMKSISKKIVAGWEHISYKVVSEAHRRIEL